MSTNNLKWDLDRIFPGGSTSEQLKTYIETLEIEIKELEKMLTSKETIESFGNVHTFKKILRSIESVTKRLGEISSFVGCLTAQDVSDNHAKLLVGKRNDLAAKYSTIMSKLDEQIKAIPEQAWKELLQDEGLSSLQFVLQERREKAMDKLPLQQEVLLNDLAVDGYHAWGEMYDTIVGKISIDVEIAGQSQSLSVGQAENKLGNPDRSVRENVFNKLEDAWLKDADLFTDTINHLAGFRLQTYKHRGWEQVLKEALEYNRMNETTLTSMWEAISNNKTPFVSYLKRKAELLGIEKMSWYDLDAPVAKSTETISYDQAAEMIEKEFGEFSSEMASFAKYAFDHRWIEAEDRAGKRPGGFCTGFPDSKETRIFMTYSGTASNVSTLAHELGHAYHQHVMDDMELLNQDYAMNVAETASTLAEMILADAAVKQAKNDEEKIALLEDKIQRSVAFFMNIHARFLFETRFYEERKKGMVPTNRLHALMKEAQEEAYCGELDRYNPIFWASKLHFHITDVPFYNFPYTFGYLFSLGIYAHAQEHKAEFEEFYKAILKDTGRMRVEDLATKHLKVDLGSLDFWEKGIQLCIADVEEFLKLTESRL
ncbi:M3 family oligoendopeptidase [Radiobacillus kanasensis]|uniref:M3 family oligoendopeptidase n=1 Tax=Radiobacillus kanasensis TaxID=2844358 RepID=UPI001E30F9EA|nr:M3 family oligoendopeptidase [Radiobacillus kanasensis]UFU00839.1 M3 family oligoendopeptidase [Radiobacillus kanasensis]